MCVLRVQEISKGNYCNVHTHNKGSGSGEAMEMGVKLHLLADLHDGRFSRKKEEEHQKIFQGLFSSVSRGVKR